MFFGSPIYSNGLRIKHLTVEIVATFNSNQNTLALSLNVLIWIYYILILPACDALHPTPPSQGQKDPCTHAPVTQVNCSVECDHRTSTYRGPAATLARQAPSRLKLIRIPLICLVYFLLSACGAFHHAAQSSLRHRLYWHISDQANNKEKAWEPQCAHAHTPTTTTKNVIKIDANVVFINCCRPSCSYPAALSAAPQWTPCMTLPGASSLCQHGADTSAFR